MPTKNKELEMFTFHQIKNEFIGKTGTEKRTRYEEKLVAFKLGVFDSRVSQKQQY